MNSSDSVSENSIIKKNQAKGWFCTWPKCPLDKNEVLYILQTKFEVEEYVICSEKHEDGSPHLHAFIKLASKKRFNKNMFDLGEYHGNYQVAKSWKAVQTYVKKGGDYVSNINVDSALQKKGKLTGLVKEDYDKNPLDLLEEGKLNFMQLKSFVNNQNLYKMLNYQRSQLSVTIAPDKKRHVWLYGETNSGKSTKLKEFLIDYGIENCFQMPYNNDWNGYLGEKYIYADEYKGQLKVTELNRICDGGAKVNTKGGSTSIRWDPVILICSQYSIDNCYAMVDQCLKDALHNRFNEEEWDYRKMGK